MAATLLIAAVVVVSLESIFIRLPVELVPCVVNRINSWRKPDVQVQTTEYT